MLFHVHIHFAGLQNLVRNQQLGGFDHFGLIALRFQDRDNRGFEQFGVRSLGLGILNQLLVGFDNFRLLGEGGRRQQQGQRQKNGNDLFHRMKPSFHIFDLFRILQILHFDPLSV